MTEIPMSTPPPEMNANDVGSMLNDHVKYRINRSNALTAIPILIRKRFEAVTPTPVVARDRAKTKTTYSATATTSSGAGQAASAHEQLASSAA